MVMARHTATWAVILAIACGTHTAVATTVTIKGADPETYASINWKAPDGSTHSFQAKVGAGGSATITVPAAERAGIQNATVTKIVDEIKVKGKLSAGGDGTLIGSLPFDSPAFKALDGGETYAEMELAGMLEQMPPFALGQLIPVSGGATAYDWLAFPGYSGTVTVIEGDHWDVPEPSSLVLMVAGWLAALGRRALPRAT
jgi:hypothetical protein